MIELKNVTKRFKRNVSKSIFRKYFKPTYESTEAVKNISFSIQEGESVAFLGPNGAGKTTTIKMLTGILYPSDGEIKVHGFNPFDRKHTFLKQIGIVMGNKAGLNWDLTANQSFRLLKDIYRIPDQDFSERLISLSKLLRVEHVLNSQVRTLSLGERMKVELIGSILHMPKILFLDEPTIGLDIESKQNIRTFLKDLNKNYGITLLLTSHDMDDIERVSDRVIMINSGQIIYDDPIQTMFEQFGSEKLVEIRLKSEKDSMSLTNQHVKLTTDRIVAKGVFEKDEIPNLMSKVFKEFDIDDVDIRSIPLEDIIQKILDSTYQ